MSAKSFGPTEHDGLLAAILLSWSLAISSAKHKFSSCNLLREAWDFIFDHIIDANKTT